MDEALLHIAGYNIKVLAGRADWEVQVIVRGIPMAIQWMFHEGNIVLLSINDGESWTPLVITTVYKAWRDVVSGVIVCGKLTIIAAIYKNDHFGILGWGIDCDDDILAGKELGRERAGKARGNI